MIRSRVLNDLEINVLFERAASDRKSAASSAAICTTRN